MHKALISYYMHRGYHNRIVLTDFGKGATVNLLQLEKIHRNLLEVIGKTDVSADRSVCRRHIYASREIPCH